MSTPVSQKYFYIRPTTSFQVLSVERDSSDSTPYFTLQRRNGAMSQLFAWVRSRKRILRHIGTNTFIQIQDDKSITLADESLLTWRFDSAAKMLKTADGAFVMKVEEVQAEESQEGSEEAEATASNRVTLRAVSPEEALSSEQCLIEIRYLLPKLFLFKVGDSLLNINGEDTTRVQTTTNDWDENSLWYRDNQGRIFNLNTGTALKVQEGNVELVDEDNATSFEWLSNGHVRMRDQPESALSVKDSLLVVSQPEEASSFVIQFIEPCVQENQHTTDATEEPASETKLTEAAATEDSVQTPRGDAETKDTSAAQDEDKITTSEPPMESPSHARQVPEEETQDEPQEENQEENTTTAVSEDGQNAEEEVVVEETVNSTVEAESEVPAEEEADNSQLAEPQEETPAPEDNQNTAEEDVVVEETANASVESPEEAPAQDENDVQDNIDEAVADETPAVETNAIPEEPQEVVEATETADQEIAEEDVPSDEETKPSEDTTNTVVDSSTVGPTGTPESQAIIEEQRENAPPADNSLQSDTVPADEGDPNTAHSTTNPVTANPEEKVKENENIENIDKEQVE